MKFRFFSVILTAMTTSILTLFIADHFRKPSPYFTFGNSKGQLPVNYTNYAGDVAGKATTLNFENAAQSSIQAVVHIKTTTHARTVVDNNANDIFSQMFGPRQYYIPSQMGSGSGVIISPDGYIVTNNHVIAEANEVTVTYNDRHSLQAKVVGTDPATDIALLKVEENKPLPYMEFGNSDDAKLGQWVLAVGYPLSLDATVTAGIISAKGRSIGVNKQSTAIESFIQTDAAVNPGNSGGALVNIAGQLIGINSAIASPTGSYAGYSYAIPANIVQKAVSDLKKYGSVQRAYLGIQYLDRGNISQDQMQSLGLDKLPDAGVYVTEVLENGAATKAGIKRGDLITNINGEPVNSQPEIQEQIARYQPGDNINVTYVRNGSAHNVSVKLTNLNGTTDIIKPESNTKLLGANFRPLNDAEKHKYQVDGGLVVTEISKGAFASQTQMHKGFIITGANNQVVKSVNDLQAAITNGKNVQISGFYPDTPGVYYFGLNNIVAKQE